MSTAAEPSSSPQTSAEPAPGGRAPQAAPPRPVAQAGAGKATASLVLGIVGAVFAILVPIVGIVLGILAVVFANQARKEGYRDGKAKAGWVLGCIALAAAVVNIVVTVALVSS